MAPPPKSTSATQQGTSQPGSGGNPPAGLEDAEDALDSPVPTPEPTPTAKHGMVSVIASGAGDGADQFGTAEVIREYGPQLLRRALWSTGNRPDAEDLVQETFIRREKHLQRRGTIRNEAAFLRKILGNLIIDYQRHKVRWTGRFVDREINENDGIAPSESEPDSDEELREAMAELPPLQQQVLHLLYGEGRSGNEVAKIVGTSPATISRIKKKALKKLEELLGES